MTEKKYKIGQILYVIPHASLDDNYQGKPIVVPLQVIEENIKTTIQGKITTYIVRDSSTTADIDKILGNVYESLDDVRAYLLDKMTKELNALIEDVKKLQNTGLVSDYVE